MSSFTSFLEMVISDGKRIGADGFRMIPVLLPEGDHEGALYDSAIAFLKANGFGILDVSSGNYGEAISSFTFGWPRVNKRVPQFSEFFASIAEGEERLLIACGENSDHVFWKYLCDTRVLHVGASWPPMMIPGYECIVVPDKARIGAIIPASVWQHYRSDYFSKFLRVSSSGPSQPGNCNT